MNENVMNTTDMIEDVMEGVVIENGKNKNLIKYGLIGVGATTVGVLATKFVVKPVIKKIKQKIADKKLANSYDAVEDCGYTVELNENEKSN